MTRKLRIMMNTNAMWAPSGYGVQAKQILPAMQKEGYPVAVINFYGQEGGMLNLENILNYPKIHDQWGMDAMINHGRHFNADVIFTLQDIWTLPLEGLNTLRMQNRRWIPIIPIDHEPVPPAIVERLKLAYRIVTYAPYGYRELKRVGLHSTYIPHTIDPQMYKKVDKSEVRKKIGIPEDMFLFGMVAANKDNPPRKSFQEVLDAFKLFYENHPNSAIYFHVLTQVQSGFPIEQYAKFLGIEKAIYKADAYELMEVIQQTDMPKIYSAMDCLLAPSTNEGFGVPIIEAASCEVPVITTDFTAQKDLVLDGVTGFKCKIATKRFSPLLAYIGIPDTQHLYEQMENVYNADREQMGKKAREFVIENFEFKKVWKEKWSPFLNTLEKEIYS